MYSNTNAVAISSIGVGAINVVGDDCRVFFGDILGRYNNFDLLS